MLKEKLYIKYQKKYDEYIGKHNKIDKLNEDIGEFREEILNKKFDLELKKNKDLENISAKSKKLKEQVTSLKEEGENSSVAQEYSRSKLQQISETENNLLLLEEKKRLEIEKIKNEKNTTVNNLQTDKKICEKKLEKVIDDINKSNLIVTFDEDKVNIEQENRKKEGIAEICSQYDSEISKKSEAMQRIDSEYNTILERELSYIENNGSLFSVYNDLKNKEAKNELPFIISNSMAEPIVNMIQRKNIFSGQKVAEIASNAAPLDDLNLYTPKWLRILVNFGLPAVALLITLLFFMLTNISLSFVDSATNAVVSFLLWILSAAVLGGIFYVVTKFILSFRKTGRIIGAAIGCVLGFYVAIHWSVTLPYEFTSAVELIIKAIICLLIGTGFCLLNTFTVVGDLFAKLGMKIGFVKNKALIQQGYAIQENIDSYYVLMNYRQIIEQIVCSNKQKQKNFISNELEELKLQKAKRVEDFSENIDKETENMICTGKEQAEINKNNYEQQQRELNQKRKEYSLKLIEYDNEINSVATKYDENINVRNAYYDQNILKIKNKLQNLKSELICDKDSLLIQLEQEILECEKEYKAKPIEYDKKFKEFEQALLSKIKETENTIAELSANFDDELNELHRLFALINNNTVGFDESQGVLSNYLYLFNDNSSEDPKEIISIEHNKKPIVFLYDIEDSTNISASLFEFMKAVLTGFYTINANDSFDVIVTDPVAKARRFEQMSMFLSIENDIRKLSVSIQNSMRKVAKTGMSIDDYNRNMALNDEDKVKFLKYKIVEFIVPEESAAQNTNFFDSDLWGTLGDGMENGFLPIFYISYSDWKNTFDQNNKLNSKFILQLKNAIGNTNGVVYKINIEKLLIEKVN